MFFQCTVSCGEGVQTRYVECMFNEQITDESFCDTVVKPDTEIRCNRGTCISPEEGDFKTGVITSNRVEGTSRWLTWDWGAVSVPSSFMLLSSVAWLVYHWHFECYIYLCGIHIFDSTFTDVEFTLWILHLPMWHLHFYCYIDWCGIHILHATFIGVEFTLWILHLLMWHIHFDCHIYWCGIHIVNATFTDAEFAFWILHLLMWHLHFYTTFTFVTHYIRLLNATVADVTFTFWTHLLDWYSHLIAVLDLLIVGFMVWNLHLLVKGYTFKMQDLLKH